MVKHLTKLGTIFGLADFFTIVGIQSCVHCPLIMECKYTKLLRQNVNLGARFDVMSQRGMDEDSWVQWKWPSISTKIHQNIKDFFGLPKPLCLKWA